MSYPVDCLHTPGARYQQHTHSAEKDTEAWSGEGLACFTAETRGDDDSVTNKLEESGPDLRQTRLQVTLLSETWRGGVLRLSGTFYCSWI